jgi:hypothetical protein
MPRKTILLALAVSLLLPAVPAGAQAPPARTPPAQLIPDDEAEAPGYRKVVPPPVVAKGPTKKIGEKIEVGTKLYLMTDHRLMGEVAAYRLSHLFPDGKSREAVKMKPPTGKAVWIPADTVRRIYVTQ